MNFLKSNFPVIIPVLYLAVVFGCIFLAFDFAGAINASWTLLLIGLTLPCSLVSISFAWPLIHGAGLEEFALMYIAFASLNAFIIHYLCMRLRKRYERREI